MPRIWPSPPPFTEAEPFLPEPDPDELAAVRMEMLRIAVVPGETDGDHRDERPFDHVDALDSVSAIGETIVSGDASVASTAYLLMVCVHAMVPELLALQIAFGSRPVQRDLDDLARLVDRAARRGLSLAEHVDELHRTDTFPDTPTSRLLRGESGRVPDAARMRQGIRVLRQAASLATGEEQATLFCTLGWLHWALGQPALAQTWLSAAILRAPDHEVAWEFFAMVGAGRPGWLRRRKTLKPRPVLTRDDR